MLKKMIYLSIILTALFGIFCAVLIQNLSIQIHQALDEGWFPPSLEYYADTGSEFVLFAQREGSSPRLRKRFRIAEVPYLCLQAITISEDRSFLLHKGASASAILRAFLKNIKNFRIKEGGSTITQQLVKNKFLSSEKTFKRKGKELIISLILENKLTKDEILELYLNTIYMGNTGAYSLYGFASASRYYFNKNLKDLSAHECALLAGIVPSPGRFNPFSQTQKALFRRNTILQKMKEQAVISEEELDIFKSRPLPSPHTPPAQASYFVQAVDRELRNLNIDLNQNLKVYTTIDLKIQNQAHQTFENTLKNLGRENLEGALVFVDLKTNQVKALVGGKNFRLSPFNRALSARRPIGSLVKPWTYLSALAAQDLDPLSLLADEPFTKENWSPKNYKNRYYGKAPLHFALAQSLNTASAQLALKTGLKNIIKTFKNLGLQSSPQPRPSIGLGALELSPLEVSQMYATLARMGSYMELSFIEKIMSGDLVVYQNNKTEEQRLQPQKTAVLIGMMKQVLQTGTAQWVKDFWPVISAGKTGTSNEERDSWFTGFTPRYLSTVWLGYDDNSPHGLSGSAGALSLWLNFMNTLDLKDSEFEWPSGVKTRFVPRQKAVLIKEEALDNTEDRIQFFSLEEDPEEKIELVFEK